MHKRSSHHPVVLLVSTLAVRLAPLLSAVAGYSVIPLLRPRHRISTAELIHQKMSADRLTSAASASVAPEPSTAAQLQDAIRTSWKSLLADLQDLRPLYYDEDKYDHQQFLAFFRHANMMYADGVTEEVAFAQEYDASCKFGSSSSSRADQPSPSEKTQDLLSKYESYRRKSAGSMSISLLGHFLNPHCAFSSSSIWNGDESFQELLLTMSLLTGIHNDLISYQKDDSWDMMTILMRVGAYTEIQAKQRCVSRHEELLRDYQHLRTRLLDRYDNKNQDNESLVFWLDTILPTYWRGILAWQCHVKRYHATDTSTEDLFQQLFPDDEFHVLVDHDTGLIPGETESSTFRSQINAATKTWAKETGLIPLFPERKWEALDLGLGSMLVHHYCRPFENEDNPRELPVLTAFAKYLGWIIIVDDVMEEPGKHKQIKAIFTECMNEISDS